MNLPDNLIAFLKQQVQGDIAAIDNIGGGCINQAIKLTMSDHRIFFLKYSDVNLPFAFESEAQGLRLINQQVVDLCPKVIAHSEHAILLEYLIPRQADQYFWQQLGQRLANLHHRCFPSFGFEINNYCGLNKQNNNFNPDGFTFFADNRLLVQAKMAFDKKLIGLAELKSVETIAKNLKNNLPQMPAVLIHGDLWSGNVFSAQQGAMLVDPACYYGWAEAELAMTCLFGGFDKRFYQAYSYHSNIDQDWRNRMNYYNLYHVLNHANMFAGGYVQQVKDIIKRLI